MKMLTGSLVSLIIAGCGGGGGGDDPGPVPAPIAGAPPSTNPAPTPTPPPPTVPSNPDTGTSTPPPSTVDPGAPTGPSNPEPGPETIGVFSGYTGNLSWLNTGVDGDGGVGAGGDGGGGVGAGGSLGRFARAEVEVTLDDGTVLSKANTDDRGLVTIKPGRNYKGGLKVEFRGIGDTVYWDEARVSDLQYPEGERLRVHVDKIRGNIGATPLTEAAVRFAETGINVPVGSSQAKVANDHVQNQFNTQLPQAFRIEDITRMPVLLRPQDGKGAITDDQPGKYAAVIAGLAYSANRFNGSLDRPALSIARQLAVDFTDGRLNGVGRNNAQLAPPVELAYEPQEFSTQLNTGIAQAVESYGVATIEQRAPTRIKIGGYAPSVLGENRTFAQLLSDGRVLNASNQELVSVSGANVRATTIFPDSAGSVLFIKRENGSMEVLGDNRISTTNGLFGVGEPAFSAIPVRTNPILDEATQISVAGSHAVARLADGAVYVWGSNARGELARDAETPFSIPPIVVDADLGPAIHVAAGDGTSVAVLASGQVRSWGTNLTGNLGQGAQPNFDGFVLPGAVVTADGSPITGVVTVDMNGLEAVALKADGTVWGWGINTESTRLFAAQITGFQPPIKKVVANRTNSGGATALDDAGNVHVFGRNSRWSSAPELRTLPSPIRDLQSRDATTFGIGFDDRLYVIESDDGAGGVGGGGSLDLRRR